MKNFIKYSISLLLALGLMYWVYKDQNVNQLWNEILLVQPFWIFLSYLSAFVAHWLRGARGVILAGNIGYQIGNSKSFYAVMLGYLVNMVLPRGGELARCAYLQKSSGLPFSTGFGILVMERMIDLVVMALFVFLSISLEYDKVVGFVFQNKGSSATNYDLIGIILALGIVMVGVLWLTRKKWMGIKFVQQLIEGLLSVFKLKKPKLFILYSVGIWVFYYLMMFFALKAFPNTAHLNPSIALAILMISTFGMIVPVPGGTGAYHYLVTKGLIAYGIAENSSSAFAAVSHALQLFEIMTLFVFAYLFVELLPSKSKTNPNL